MSTNAMHNLTSTPSQTPVRKSGFVTPRVVGPNGVVYSHKRTKSKVAVEKSPATGNPFYNPPSFLSPKISKKSHRKNVSITNSISLTHLDTDLQIQQMQQLGRSGSPDHTPLRTPGRRSDVQYIYGPDDDYDYEDDDGENDKVGHSHQDDHERDDHGDESDDDGDDGEDDHDDHDDEDLEKRNIMMMKNNALLDSHMLMNSGLDQPSANSTVNDGTFIMPNILMKHKFGDKLVQSSNDLNSVLSGNSLENENDTASLFDNMSSANFVNINYLNGMFIPDPSAVESLQQDIFAYPSSTKDTNEAYYGSLGHETPHKQKYQYQKRPIEQHQQSEESSPVLLKASSLPQTEAEPVSVDSKIQRSGSSFNLSNIAASREGKNASKHLEQHNIMMSDRYRYHRPDSLMAFQENSPPQTHAQAQAQAQQQYAMIDPKTGYESSSHMSSDMMTPVNTAPGSSSVPTATIPMSTSGTLQQVAESASYRGKELSIPRSSSSKKLLESPTMKTRSKSKRSSFALSDIKHPEKLDLPQQSARSRSRSKKTLNDEKKIHECPLCHMKFQRPEHVKRHMLSHSSEKPFECPESGCNKRFNRNDNLKQHLRNIHKKQI